MCDHVDRGCSTCWERWSNYWDDWTPGRHDFRIMGSEWVSNTTPARKVFGLKGGGSVPLPVPNGTYGNVGVPSPHPQPSPKAPDSHYDPDHPGPGVQFNPQIKIDTSNASVAPPIKEPPGGFMPNQAGPPPKP